MPVALNPCCVSHSHGEMLKGANLGSSQANLIRSPGGGKVGVSSYIKSFSNAELV